MNKQQIQIINLLVSQPIAQFVTIPQAGDLQLILITIKTFSEFTRESIETNGEVATIVILIQRITKTFHASHIAIRKLQLIESIEMYLVIDMKVLLAILAIEMFKN
jgi:hypothetical protein